ncbi:Insulinoma-associated protein [Schistosoma japonicum]|uniref:Insulinoma-associated protein n=1 Tax=Schistosoma japonicum TaxID=6182 RepID=A0A4Z2DEQ7_SCHJA|nr:Insulinoma-associated protein [Schistosoma japonicum]
MSEVCFHLKSNETMNVTEYTNQLQYNVETFDKSSWILSKLENEKFIKPTNLTMNTSSKSNVTMSNIQNNQRILSNSLKHLTQLSKTKIKSKSNEHLTSPINGVYIIPHKLTQNNTNNEVTESKQTIKLLAEIPNHIGEYTCQLCFHWFPDAFSLAEHPCSCMASLAYPCEICGKVFNCPANLASHQRWHKPRIINNNTCQMKTEKPKQPDNEIKTESGLKIAGKKLRNSAGSVERSKNSVSCSPKQNLSLSVELDQRQQQLSSVICPEYINHVFKTSKHYRISSDEKMDDAQTFQAAQNILSDKQINHTNKHLDISDSQHTTCLND